MFQFEIDEPDSTLVHPFIVGDRVRVTDHFGTVRYIGEVEGYTGIWLGLEWDDPSRGKHGGSLGDRQYFSVSTPNSASFVKIGKAEKIRSISQALVERYDPELIPTGLKSIEDRLHKKKIVYEQLRVVNLGRHGVTEVGSCTDILELCPNVQVLELNDNLLRQWGPVLQLCSGWSKNLLRLDLSRNPLIPPTTDNSEEDLALYFKTFSKLEGVVLGGLGYSWEHFIALAELWPNISLLTIPFNHVSTLSPLSVQSLDNFSNLTSLDLEKNDITSWDEILSLGVLPKLESINLTGNQLTRICFPSTASDSFPSLRRLNISDNFIGEWSSVSELDKLQGLRELRMDTNPVLNTLKRNTNRQIIIARLQRIQKLEGVEILRQDRRDAELDYVKLYASDYSKMETRESFLLEHPLYLVLLKKHGEGDCSDLIGSTTHSIKSNTSSFVRLIVVAESGLKGPKEIEKQFIRTMTVQKVKALLYRTFAIPRVPLHIMVTSCRNPAVSFPLDNDLVEIGQCSLEDGDTLRLHW